MKLTNLISAAPWREAKTYRHTWPHEYVLLQKDGERQLMRAIWQRMHDGEAFNGYFFSRPTIYLFIGDYKYWFMSSLDTVNTMLEDEEHNTEMVLNRARLYHDRRDFYTQYGDTGMREDYPSPPHWMQQNDTHDTKEQQP